jgi:hypothetical protein
MKIKYYLRGIGIGIIFSTIVFSVAITSNKASNISDEAVMKRARELGMVYSNKKDDSLTLNDLINQSDKTNKESEVEDNLVTPPTVEPTPLIEPTPTMEPTPTIEPTKKVEPTPTIEPTATMEPTKAVELTSITEPTKDVKEYVSIKVTKGMSSESVAKLLADKGVISNSSDFNKYLKQHDYSRKINVGTFKIKLDASYEEIAKIITQKK